MSELRHFEWEHTINFEDGSITHLFIENPITMRTYISELMDQINGKGGSFVLSEKGKELPIAKNLSIITDPLNIILEEKKINTKVNKDLLQISQSPELQQASFSLISTIEQYAEKLLDNCIYNIDFDSIDESKILKMLNFHITEDFETIASKLLEYLNTSNDILKITNFVIVNANIFFAKEELDILEKEISSLKHNVLFIDQSNRYNLNNVITIDFENCEIY